MTTYADDREGCMARATAQGRIDEALAHLERAAGRTFRRTPTGELIESVGCILTGRKGRMVAGSEGRGRMSPRHVLLCALFLVAAIALVILTHTDPAIR